MKSLYFTRIHVENWRNFQGIDVPLANRVFLVGPNASGKSNFLDLFRFLHDIVTTGGGLQQAVEKRGGVSPIRCLAARQSPDIVIHVQMGHDENPDDWRYELHFSDDGNGKPIIKRELLFHRGQNVL